MAPLRFRAKKLEPRQGKSPLPGERKAMRKRILLSNNSALPVPGLAELGARDMLSEGSLGKMMSLPGQLQDQLRTIEAFKPSQFWPMFRQPSTLIRSETVDLATRMQRAVSNKDTLRLVVDGDRITGKSLLLLQTQAHAFLNDWIVIHIPEGELFIS
jgi:small subunit ribosomal protein S29